MGDLRPIIDNQFDNFQVMYQLLWSDVEETGRSACQSRLAIDVSRRSFVRACYAFMEGVATRTEIIATFIRVIRKDGVPSKHLHRMSNGFLKQDKRQANDVEHDKRNFTSRVKDSLKTLSAATGKPFDLSEQNKEWDDFQKAVKIRDRITHPKIAEDLAISNDEMLLVMNSSKWFHDQFTNTVLGKNM